MGEHSWRAFLPIAAPPTFGRSKLSSGLPEATRRNDIPTRSEVCFTARIAALSLRSSRLKAFDRKARKVFAKIAMNRIEFITPSESVHTYSLSRRRIALYL